MEDGWRPPFIKAEKCESFPFIPLIFMFEINRKHRAIKRGDLDELHGDVNQSQKNTYPTNTS
jgi:hypothetical protein